MLKSELTTNMTIPERLSELRALMSLKNIDAWIIPGTDPHQSEYLPERWNERAWISGFTGSFGQIVVTQNNAGLWTDSRYFLQAEKQLHHTGIKLYKLRVEGEATIDDFLKNELSNGAVLGINPKLFTVNAVKNFMSSLSEKGITLNTQEDLLSEIWTDRPPIPNAPSILLSTQYAGLSIKKKLAIIRKQFKEENWTLLVTALDEIAWLFNIRGRDIKYNPLTVSWAIVGNRSAILFVDKEKIDQDLRISLAENGVTTAGYDEIATYLSELPAGETVFVDPDKVNQDLFQSIPEYCTVQVLASPLALLKAKKNSTELDGIRNAMEKDGVAMVRFLMQLEKTIKNDEKISEYDIGILLKDLRSKQADFFGESFQTIAGYMANGAIVHYAPSEKSSATLEAGGIILVDSGGQYYDGTTDITRTIKLGKVSDEIKTDFTNVLKGVIALAKAIFPKGTCGIQLDILARNAMWQEKIDYGHGTGHGVGHFLNVHEGPQTIRKEGNMVPFEEGMLITIEPGIYKPDRHGIRIENMVTTVNAGESEFGSFLQFETLTLCPIDLDLIMLQLLTRDEIEWINAYHRNVYLKLSPYLDKEEAAWLKTKTRKVDD